MSEETTAVAVETPQKRVRVKLPRRSTIIKVATHVAAFGAGAFVAVKRVKNACSCETDVESTSETTDN